MGKTIREQLTELADHRYQAFSAALIPNINNVMGVRLPELRKIARRIAKGDWRTYLADAQDEWFEEVMLQGMVIGYAQADIEEALRYVAWFVPKIDNWSVCDSFCASLKMTSSHKQIVWEFLQPYFASQKEYDLRFAVVMLLNYFVEDEYILDDLKLLDQINHDGYYVKMAVAWAISICFVKMPGATMAYLENNSLDKWTFNKALQKITESYQVEQETKRLIRGMKRK